MDLDEQEFGERLYRYGGPAEADAALELFLSPDKMKLTGRFIPPKEGGALLVGPEIEAALMSLGIVFGVDREALQRAVFACNMDHAHLPAVVLARGQEPKSEKPPYLKLEPRLFQHHFPEQSPMSNVDHKKVQSYVVVHKGELLARAVKPRAGQNGYNLMGEALAPARKDIKFLKPGAQTVFLHGKVFAKVPGRFIVNQDYFDVVEDLEILGNVDYSVGHIDFPGNVTIKGMVCDGFHLKVGGRASIKEVLDASEVWVKGDLEVGGGIIGKKPGIVRVGGNLRCQYIENAQVEVLGDLYVAKGILNSRVFCNGTISFGETSRLLSSEVWAQGSLEVGKVGSEAGKVQLVLGRDFAMARRVETLKTRIRELETELESLRERAGRLAQPLTEQERLFRPLLDQIQTLTSQLNDLSPKVLALGLPTLRVGEIGSGAVLEIAYARLEIHQTLTNKEFVLSQDGRNILTEPAPTRS